MSRALLVLTVVTTMLPIALLGRVILVTIPMDRDNGSAQTANREARGELARRSAIASAVEFEPVPATTGTRPAAASMASSAVISPRGASEVDTSITAFRYAPCPSGPTGSVSKTRDPRANATPARASIACAA